MTPIVTLTVNPALDVSTSVERVIKEHKLRCGPARLDPGGGGINVARVVKRLGGEVTALYAVGGPMGGALEQLLAMEGIDCCPIRIECTTREDFTVDETATGAQFRFVLQGPELSEAEWRRCLDAVAERLTAGAYVVASGSLPPGVPDDFYGRVARLAKERGARCVVDTSGAALHGALATGVYLVKPSRREMRSLTGTELDTAEEQDRAARALVERGQAEVVALTLGGEGAVLAWSGGVTRIPAPKVEQRSAVGAGDSFLGGLVLKRARDRPLEEAFRYASAAGAAAMATPGTALCPPELVEELYAKLSAGSNSH